MIDVDHYLPDHYIKVDAEGASHIINNLRGTSTAMLTRPEEFREVVDNFFEAGNGSLSQGLRMQFGLESSAMDEERFKTKFGVSNGTTEDCKTVLIWCYGHLNAFLEAYLQDQLTAGNRYIHFTPNDNIIITTLNKRSGLAVIIESRDTDGVLLSLLHDG